MNNNSRNLPHHTIQVARKLASHAVFARKAIRQSVTLSEKSVSLLDGYVQGILSAAKQLCSIR